MLIHVKGSWKNECKCDESVRKIQTYKNGLHLYVCQKCGSRFFSLKFIVEKKEAETRVEDDDCRYGIW